MVTTTKYPCWLSKANLEIKEQQTIQQALLETLQEPLLQGLHPVNFKNSFALSYKEVRKHIDRIVTIHTLHGYTKRNPSRKVAAKCLEAAIALVEQGVLPQEIDILLEGLRK